MQRMVRRGDRFMSTQTKDKITADMLRDVRCEMADLMEDLLVKAELELTPRKCRYCEAELANPRERGLGHQPSCPLAIR
mgnify:CR=1 FL=1